MLHTILLNNVHSDHDGRVHLTLIVYQNLRLVGHFARSFSRIQAFHRYFALYYILIQVISSSIPDIVYTL